MMLLCQLHEQRDEAEALVSTLVALSSLHLMVGEADEALACLERALDDAQAKLPANLHLHLACISPVSRLHLPCIFPASRLHLACISAQAKLPANLPLRAKVMSELGNVWVQLGHAERAVELYTLALGAAEEAGDSERCMRVHGNLGLALKVRVVAKDRVRVRVRVRVKG